MRGVFFMCRKNQLITVALISFGAGILVGSWIRWKFLCVMSGLAMIGLGFLFSGGKRWNK